VQLLDPVPGGSFPAARLTATAATRPQALASMVNAATGGRTSFKTVREFYPVNGGRVLVIGSGNRPTFISREAANELLRLERDSAPQLMDEDFLVGLAREAVKRLSIRTTRDFLRDLFD
jgi:hypothetical protein